MSISKLLRNYAGGLSWMLHAGWPLTQATACMLLCAYGAAAIGDAIRRRSHEFAASTHAICHALQQRAWTVSTPAPPTYSAVDGTFGLAVADPAWLDLLSPTVDGTVRRSILTSAPVQACDNPAALPEEWPEEGGEQLEQVAPQPAGTQVPPDRLSSAALELREGGALVRFISETVVDGDRLRSLIQTSPTGYVLPP